MKKWQFFFISAISTIAVVVIGTQLIPITVEGNDKNTAMFQANLQNTGEYPNGGPKEFNEQLWNFPTDAEVRSSPAVSEGVVYFGSADSNFYAVDTETGKQLWSFSTDAEVRSSPAVSEGVVYFGSDDNSLHAVK